MGLFLCSFLRAKNTYPFMKREDKIAIFQKRHILFSLCTKIKEAHEMLESNFQAQLIRELKIMFPGCIIQKNDSSYIQGIPDLTIFYKDKWATLECKKNASAKKQPNQEYYVGRMNEMSFSRFIYPENKEEILYELQQAFKS